MIAEPQRAFFGGQIQLVLPQLTHYEIELPVPELGGRSAKRSTTPAISLRCCLRPHAKRGPGSTRPSISSYSSILPETLRHWMFGCSYVVAGAGFEPATFGL